MDKSESTWGALEYTQRYLYDCHPDVLMAPGGHDVSRRCQGKVADTSTLASRYEMLKTVWKQDVYYHSEVLDDRVMLVILNNGENRYYAHQTEKLRVDIERARRENLIILLFQHEPICTHNDRETAVTPLWVNLSAAPRDYCNGLHFIGNTHNTDDESMEMYRLITESADTIKAVFCGHMHNEVYTEIMGTDHSAGKPQPAIIPQYVLDAVAYDKGHMLAITVR